jgi:hypothetical protein
MDNKILFGILTILFNAYGVPCFLQGDTKTGIIRIVISLVTCGIGALVLEIMGIILGIKVLTMSDEEYAAQKGTLDMGFPKMNVNK